jgi:tRNA threonylcarbamoyladenosine biosynthesis protein TsaB
MQYILLIESSTDVCSVAVSRGNTLLSLCESFESNSHTEKLTLLISQCIKEAGIGMQQLDAIAISDGPGSYTSLRIGAATAKAMCYALHIPLIAIGSLTILAHGISREHIHPNDLIVPMIDARRMEVYLRLFDQGLNPLSSPEAVILDENTRSNYIQNNQVLHICGNGAEKYFNAFPHQNIKLHHLHTSSVYMISSAVTAFKEQQFVDVAYFSPDYLKDPNITKSTKKIF